jgi:hypothetical protein
MPAATPAAGERLPRRARYLIPAGTPRRAEILASLTLLVLLAGALFAQVTLVLAVVFLAFDRLSRLRPSWLLTPAACGLAWLLAAGLGRTLAGFWAVPGRVAGLLATAAAHPATLPALSGIPAVIGRAAAAQFPAALILAAAICAAGCWARWLHTDEWDLPGYRTGLASRCRRWWTAAFLRAGGVLTPDGVCLGAELGTGRRAAVSWREAAGGVLVTGAAPAAVSAAGLQLAHAAIRLRKPVLVVDLAGDRHLPESLAAVCAAAGAPLLRFGYASTGGYEPFRDTEPACAAGLVMGILDAGVLPEAARAACRDCLTTALALLGAAPGEPGAAALDELVALLRPGALRARAAQVPGWHPDRAALAGRAGVAERWLERDEASAQQVAAQLSALRASDLGAGLAPPGQLPGSQISLAGVIRERAVALFSLGGGGAGGPAAPGPAAGMIATLLALDVAARYAGLHRSGTAPDGLAWFSECGHVAPAALAGLAGAAPALVPLFSTTSPVAAGRLAGQASVRVVARLADAGLAGQLAAQTGTRLVSAARAGVVTGVLPAAPMPAAAVPAMPAPVIPGPVTPLAVSAPAPPPAGWPAGVTGHAAGQPAPGIDAGPFGPIRTFVVTAESLCSLPGDELVLIAGQPGSRARVVRTRAIRGRVRPAPAAQPRHASAAVWPR